MISIPGFIGGFVIGIVGREIYKSHKEKKEFKEYQKWWNDPSTEEFLYNDEGEKIWSNKKGCIGPATYIKQ